MKDNLLNYQLELYCTILDETTQYEKRINLHNDCKDLIDRKSVV